MPDFFTSLRQSLVVAVIRSDCPETARELARCAARGGIKLIELSCTTPCLDSLLSQLQGELPQCVFGVGTITDRDRAEAALNWGSQFLFSPIHGTGVINLAKQRGIPIVAGASTPTEIFSAWQGGADAVKVFPIANLGGISYIHSLKPIFPDIPLIPTGGVTLENASGLLAAGAVGLGISGYFFPAPLVKHQDWQGITQRVQQLLESIGL